MPDNLLTFQEFIASNSGKSTATVMEKQIEFSIDGQEKPELTDELRESIAAQLEEGKIEDVLEAHKIKWRIVS